jgi:hypothetical protein
MIEFAGWSFKLAANVTAWRCGGILKTSAPAAEAKLII